MPRYAGEREHYYRKVGTRKAQAISESVLCGSKLEKSTAITHERIWLGSVAPVPLRCKKTEEFLTGQPVTDGAPALKVFCYSREFFL